MDQRFKQFSGLVDNCEFNTGEKETNPTDLQGFWEMIYFQVRPVLYKINGFAFDYFQDISPIFFIPGN